MHTKWKKTIFDEQKKVRQKCDVVEGQTEKKTNTLYTLCSSLKRHPCLL